MTRKTLVKLAGCAGSKGRLVLLLRYEMDRSFNAFGRALSARWWGPTPPPPSRKVSVPRSLRWRLGRYIEEIKVTGRRKKDRRKHNRRWMPEQDCECE
jgi:hypothetical protein